MKVSFVIFAEINHFFRFGILASTPSFFPHSTFVPLIDMYALHTKYFSCVDACLCAYIIIRSLRAIGASRDLEVLAYVS